MDETALLAKPLIYCHFAQGMGDPKYMPVVDFTNLQKLLVDALKSYNDFNSIMSKASVHYDMDIFCGV